MRRTTGTAVPAVRRGHDVGERRFACTVGAVTTRMEYERRRRDWSRAELGRQARVHPSDVGRIESGRLRPYPPQLARIARVLGLRLDAVLQPVPEERVTS